MSGGVDQIDLHIPMAEADTGGLDGDTPPALHRQSVSMGGAGIHAALGADGAGVSQQLLGKCCFSGVHVGKYTDISYLVHEIPL